MPNSPPILRRPLSLLREFLRGEATGGFALVASAALALLVANSGGADVYRQALGAEVAGMSLLHWINDGLMAVFFLLVGLEIKRELLDGRLRSWPDRALPGVCALGGMAVPAVLYVAINASSPETLRGWAIPTATDIAFALGVIALFGSRVPVSLKVFLTALAILDDLGAILIIAVFYTADVSLGMLLAAAGVWALLIGLNKAGVSHLAPYLLLGLLLWFFVLKSGVHATVAGVLMALAIPIRLSPGRPDDRTSPLHRLEHRLNPWCAFLVLPIFGFANAGVSLSGLSPSVLGDPVTLGVLAGLFVGKQAGVMGTLALMVALGWAQRPEGSNWGQVYGVALLCGVGFTMSLFIGLLAFPGGAALQSEIKIGVLAGSITSMLAGSLVLALAGSAAKKGAGLRRSASKS